MRLTYIKSLFNFGLIARTIVNISLLASFAVIIGWGVAFAILKTKPPVPLVSYNDLTPSAKKQVDCLAENIYHEARSEPEEGQLAVALTTMNRVNSEHYPKTICAVVKQRTANVCQFSWWCENVYINDKASYNQSRQLAMDVYINYERMKDITAGALFYHASYVSPGWKNVVYIKQIGTHKFYGLKT